MKRLVYAPKAFAYIEGDNGIVDVSDDIVSGSVSRKINQVSQAELVLRNKDMKYTQQGAPVFHPMDKITIYLQRLPGVPVQTFTGYLDSSPYLQLYPGNCTITASCTLKRLLYTYWDQGLAFTNEYMEQFGWTPNYATGQIFNPGVTSQTALDPTKDEPKKMNLTDASLGRLLFHILRDVGNWDPSTIFVEKLPETLPKRIAEIYSQFQTEDATIQRELQDFFKKIIGDGAQGTGGGTNDVTGPKGTGKLIPGQATKWTASWYGDVGGSCGNNSTMNGGMTFAELSNNYSAGASGCDFKALGGLPCKAFVKVNYGGKSVVVQKADVGCGGPGLQGTTRGIDLWSKPARALGIESAGTAVVSIEPVKDNHGTPYTNSNLSGGRGNATSGGTNAPTKGN